MKRFKSYMLVLIIITILTYTVGCSKKTDEIIAEPVTTKLQVVTSLFPQYDFVREIGKDRVEVSLLLPPGVESHSYDPTPRDVVNIQKADVFIYTGEYMEPWAHRVIDITKGEEVLIVESGKGIELMDEDDHLHHEEDNHNHHDHHDEEEVDEGEEEDHHHGGKDPHIWVDPLNAQIMVDNILEGLVTADPENESFYKENAEEYKERLNQLHNKFTETFQKTEYNTIMYGGHFALGYFTKRYNLDHISPYSGFAPDAEPTPQRISDLIKTINSTGIKVIYYEELIDPKVARVISEQTGAEMMLLHAVHNISKDELEAEVSYISIMEDNLEKLKIGLGYRE